MSKATELCPLSHQTVPQLATLDSPKYLPGAKIVSLAPWKDSSVAEKRSRRAFKQSGSMLDLSLRNYSDAYKLRNEVRLTRPVCRDKESLFLISFSDVTLFFTQNHSFFGFLPSLEPRLVGNPAYPDLE